MMVLIQLAPSLLAADFSRLGEELHRINDSGADLLHLDVMDGHFVPNISFGPPVIAALRAHSDLPFDVHLMLAEPQRYISACAKAGADILTVHIESKAPFPQVLEAIRAEGMTPCLSLKPGTEAGAVFPYLELLGMVLVMTVEPGFGGQAFLPDMLPKIAALRGEIKRRGLDVDIQVDGGIHAENIALSAAAGANIFVAGSAVFRAADMALALRTLRDAAVGAIHESP